MPTTRKSFLLGGCLLLSAVIAFLDHITGYEIGFFVFYFIPVAMGAWIGKSALGTPLAIGCALIWLLVDYTAGHPYSQSWYALWNALTRCAAFAVLAMLVARLRDLLEKERTLTAQLNGALEQVKELRGLLPICSACKKIRNDSGYWENIETYISQHSHAEFTHGICPDCSKRLYPELFK